MNITTVERIAFLVTRQWLRIRETYWVVQCAIDTFSF